MIFDLVVKNARIVDGTGAPWFKGDLAVAEGRIAYIGTLPREVEAEKVIDASHRYLMPGFIDIHTHSDFELLRDPDMAYKLRQGVTTIAIGQCGYSAAPIKDENLGMLDQYVGFLKAGVEPEWSWRRFGQWLDHLESLPLGVNVASFVGHGTIRIAVMGFENRPPSQVELNEMRGLVKQSREEGAAGMTSGLIYAPGIWATPSEIETVAAGLAVSRGLYESHMRSESDQVVASVKETIAVGEANNIPVQISHHKAAGRKNWGLVEQTLAIVDKARDRGVDVSINQYPYEAASTTLRAILPAWVQEGGIEALIRRLRDKDIRKRLTREIESTNDWENYFLHCGGADGIILLFFPHTPQYEGKTLLAAAEMMGKEPLETAYDLILANRGEDNSGYLAMSSRDVEMVMRHPAVLVASDAIPAPLGAKVHPRVYSTFPRVLDKYVRQQKLLSLEEAVLKMTSFPAQRLGLSRKGILKQNLDADLVLVDMERIRDNASFESPYEAPKGIDLVIVNGTVAVENGDWTGRAAGKILRGT